MSGTAESISLLASADPEARCKAALELYRAGRNAGDSAINAWLTGDAELADLLMEQVLDLAELALKPRLRRVVVGIAVRPKNFQKIREVNGSPRLAEIPPDQDAMEFELHCKGAQLDILTTRDPRGSGAMAKFLEKFGEGIQQVEYFVRDVDRATQILRERFGEQPIYPQTHAGADGTRVNFFLSATPEGHKILIEFVQT